jgi:hypothetical protein
MEVRQAIGRRFMGLNSAREPGMPAGARQTDCEPAPDLLADASAAELWAACDESQQESVSVGFLESQADLLRDAVLDVQSDSSLPRASSPRGGGAWLGEIVWEIWVGYRDRQLRAMRRRGELTRD